jgi:DedD protein
MAWFNFGNKDGGMRTKASVQKPVETVDAMRQRAKYRLIGAVVLVLAGVVGFPMLFDSQPRPVAVDIPIEIPDKAKVRPLGAPPPAVTSAPAVPAKVDDSASLSGKEEIVSTSKADTKTGDKKPSAQLNSAQAASKSVAESAAIAAAGALKSTDKASNDAAKAAAASDKAAADKVAADKMAADKARKLAEEDKAKKLKAQVAEKVAADKVAEASRAKALLDGAASPSKPATAATVTPAATAPAAAGETRYIVQFGAFSDADKAQEARRKVEKVGLKTYSQVAKTADGDRIRVRVGPFTNKDEADKAAAKIKALDLPASILTL